MCVGVCVYMCVCVRSVCKVYVCVLTLSIYIPKVGIHYGHLCTFSLCVYILSLAFRLLSFALSRSLSL